MPYLYHGFVNPHSDSADSTLTRPSNWNARLQYGNFGNSGPAGTDAIIHETLTGNRTYYIRTDGSDANDGLTNTAGGAFATWNHAIDTLQSIDGNGFDVTLQGNNATHTDGMLFHVEPIGIRLLIVDCAGGTISSSGDCVSVAASAATGGVFFSNMKLVSAAGNGITAAAPVYVELDAGIEFGAVANSHINITGPSVSFAGFSNYTISGGAVNHIATTGFNASGCSVSITGVTVTISGGPAFSSAFAHVQNNNVLVINGNTYNGAATGKRYVVAYNSAIKTAGAGESYLPGNSTGSVDSATFGVYT